WISEKASSVADTFKSVLGIASPSKVFAGFGRDIVAGLVHGIRGKAGDAEKASVELARLAAKAFSKGDKATAQRLRTMAVEATRLASMRKAIEAQSKALDEARDKLKDLRADRAAMREQVAGSIRGELDLTQGIGQPTTDSLGRQTAGKTTFASVAGIV